jgi:hypothetical protein
METKQIRQIPKITAEKTKIRRRRKSKKSDYRDDGKEWRRRKAYEAAIKEREETRSRAIY